MHTVYHCSSLIKTLLAKMYLKNLNLYGFPISALNLSLLVTSNQNLFIPFEIEHLLRVVLIFFSVLCIFIIV